MLRFYTEPTSYACADCANTDAIHCDDWRKGPNRMTNWWPDDFRQVVRYSAFHNIFDKIYFALSDVIENCTWTTMVCCTQPKWSWNSACLKYTEKFILHYLLPEIRMNYDGVHQRPKHWSWYSASYIRQTYFCTICYLNTERTMMARRNQSMMILKIVPVLKFW